MAESEREEHNIDVLRLPWESETGVGVMKWWEWEWWGG